MSKHETRNDYPEAIRLIRSHDAVEDGQVTQYGQAEIELHSTVLSPLLTNTTRFFLENINLRDRASVLELGTGAGLVLVLIGRQYHQLELSGTDINASAVELTKRNLRRNGVCGDIYRGSLFEPLPDRTYDYVLFNPPLLVVNDVPPPGESLSKAIFDFKGRAIRDFFQSLPGRLHRDSVAYLVYTNRQNYDQTRIESERIMALSAESGLECKVVASLAVDYETYSVYAISK